MCHPFQKKSELSSCHEWKNEFHDYANVIITNIVMPLQSIGKILVTQGSREGFCE